MSTGRKIELMLLALSVVIAVVALVPNFGQWLFPKPFENSQKTTEPSETPIASIVNTKSTPTKTSTSRPTNTPFPTVTPTRTHTPRPKSTPTSTFTPTPTIQPTQPAIVSLPLTPVVIRDSQGRCLDLPYGVSENENLIQVYGCHGGYNQQWIFTSNGEIRDTEGKCLDVRSSQTVDGTLVQLYECTGGKNQKWVFTLSDEIRGLGGKCLDASRDKWNGEYSTQELFGSPVQLYQCNGGQAQKWSTNQ